MRKIKSKYEKEKSEKRRNIIWGSIIIIILLFGTAGYAFFSSPKEEGSNKISCNGMEFEKYNNGYWRFVVNNYEFYTSYNPKEIINISVPAITLEEFNNKPLYYSGNQRFVNEIYRNFQYFTSRTQEVCLENTNCTKDLPTKNCTETIIIIEETDFNEEENGEVEREGNCIIIKGKYNELLKSTDAFIFRAFGII